MTIGVGFIGCGQVGRLHTSALRDVARDGADIRGVAVVDPDGHSRAMATANFPFAREVTDWRAVVEDPEVDAVYVCLPTHLHVEVYTAVLGAGKHLYAEKPIAPTLDGVRAVAAAAGAAGTAVQVGFQSRFHAALNHVRSLVGSGELGPPMTYLWRDDEAFPTTSVEGAYSDWRSDAGRAGAGVVLEHSIHGVDVLRWTFGAFRSVRATTRNVLGFDVEDTAAMHLEHDSGVSGTLVTVYGGVVGRTESRFEVLCERGIVELTWGGPVLVEDPQLTLRVQRAGEPAVDLDPRAVLDAHLAGRGWARTPFFWHELAATELFRAIAEGRQPSPGIDDAVAAHELVDAAYRSARTGETVTLG